VYKKSAPYEVLYTKWISYEELIEIKKVEEMLEVYYNSGQFQHTIEKISGQYENAYDMFWELYRYYEKEGLCKISHNRIARYRILYAFILEKKWDEKFYKELLLYDLYLREKVKNRPDFLGEYRVSKEEIRQIFIKQGMLPVKNMLHIEKFFYDEKGKQIKEPRYVLFDYTNRSKIDNQAEVKLL